MQSTHNGDFVRCLEKMRTRHSLDLDLAFGNFKLLLFKDNIAIKTTLLQYFYTVAYGEMPIRPAYNK